MLPIVALALLAFGLVLNHREVMQRLRVNADTADVAALVVEVRRLREELDTLRGSTTGFDLSFDKRLDSLEARADAMEQRIAGRTADPGAQWGRPMGSGQ